MKTGNNNLRDALLERVLAEYKNVPVEQKIKYEFTPAFTKKINSLLDKTPQSERNILYFSNRPPTKAGRWAKAALLAAVLISCMVLTVIAAPAICDTLVRLFFRDDGGNCKPVFAQEEERQAAEIIPTEIEQIYSFDYVPEGYVLTSHSSTPLQCITAWEAEDSSKLVLSQYVIPQDGNNTQWFAVNSCNAAIYTVIINDYIATAFQEDDTTTYLWVGKEYYFSLQTNNNLTASDIMRITQNMCPLE